MNPKTEVVSTKRKLKEIAVEYWWAIPLFIFYFGYTLYYSSGELQGDEPRYFRHATYMLQGAYTDASDPEFLSGPGYPLLLLPFVAVDAPLTVIHLVNPFLLITAVIFFYKTLSLYVSRKLTLVATILFGLYPFTLQWLSVALSDELAVALSCAFMYFFCRASQEQKIFTKYTLAATLSLGWLILTKVIFSYVIIVLILASTAFWFFSRDRKAIYPILIGIGSLLLCVPYLIHTYQLTGKTMYWATAGGQQLYFHASPFENEFGDWQADRKIFTPNSVPLEDQFDLEQLSRNHIGFYKTLPYHSADSATVTLERDELFKAKAMEFIKAHPEAFVKNSIAGLTRLFFNYPHSYTRQHMGTIKYILVNMFLVVLGLLLIYPTLVARKIVPLEIWALVFILATFLGGHSIANGWVRHLITVTPIIFLYLAFGFGRILEIKIRR